MSIASMNQSDLYDLVFDDGGDACELIEKKTIDKWRWGTVERAILHELATDTFWAVTYRQHTTDGMQANTFKAKQVKLVDKTITEYVEV